MRFRTAPDVTLILSYPPPTPGAAASRAGRRRLPTVVVRYRRRSWQTPGRPATWAHSPRPPARPVRPPGQHDWADLSPSPLARRS